MNEYQIAKLLQIVGAVFGAFGGIILNPNAMQKSSSWLTRTFLKPGDELTHTFELVNKYLPEISSLPGMKYNHFMSLAMFSNWIEFGIIKGNH